MDTELNPEVTYLMTLIADEMIINKTLERLQIDPKRMAINKINEMRINKAEEILHELNTMMFNKTITSDIINSLSEEYDRYIPHIHQQLLNTTLIVATNIENVKVIKNIYDTYKSIIKNKKSGKLYEKHMTVYDALNIKISVLTSTNNNYDTVMRAINFDKNTSNIVRIYELFDEERNEKFNKNGISDKKLLFHGSPVTNWFSILKNGLYIDSKRAGVPVNGKAYGNGIYFSDQLSFSLDYSKINSYDESKVYILGLFEVALDAKAYKGSPIFVIFNAEHYVFRYLVLVRE
jgi:hypothetical protein